MSYQDGNCGSCGTSFRRLPHRAHGLCETCYKQSRRDGAIGRDLEENLGLPIIRPTTPQQTTAARNALNYWLNQRRARGAGIWGLPMPGEETQWAQEIRHLTREEERAALKETA